MGGQREENKLWAVQKRGAKLKEKTDLRYAIDK